MKKRPLVLSIAGFDPSGGAGVLADIKVFEQHKVQGMAVVTGNTIQTEDTFVKVEWVNEDFIGKQLGTLLSQYQFEYIKIGLVPSFDFLLRVLKIPELKTAKVIWDPILGTSSGFDFQHQLDRLEELLQNIEILTPNWNEIKTLSGEEDPHIGAAKLARFTNVYLKGGHADEKVGKDYLYTSKGKVYPFNPMGKYPTPKHGSGCVFSSALTASLAKEFPLIKACLRSKKYTTELLESNKGLLGYHKK